MPHSNDRRIESLQDPYRERLAAIVESSRDAIIGKDLDGVVTSWNPAATTIFGYSVDEMIGQSITRLIPADRLHEEADILDRLRRGERVDLLETVRCCKDGRRIDVAVTISPIRDGSGRIVGASKIARDISSLKEREREIARLAALYAALSQINQAIVWTSDRQSLFDRVCRVLTQEGGLRLAWIGWLEPSSARLAPVAWHGDPKQLLDSIQVYVDERPQGQGPSGIAFRTGTAYVGNDILEDPVIAPWREAFTAHGVRSMASLPIRTDGAVRGVLCVYSDRIGFFQAREMALLEEAATDLSFALDNFRRDEARREAENRLRSEKSFSDSLIESMPGVVYFYDVHGRFLRWNRNFETVSGYSAAQIATMNPEDFFDEADKPLLRARIAEVFTTGESSVEAGFRTRSGAVLPYYFTGRRVVMDGSLYLAGVGVDVSARRRAESERELRYRAEAADRIKSAFLATMSHELRTPLNSIIGFTGILARGLAGPLNDEQTKQIEMVRSSARHLLALVNDVLDISKIEAGQLEIFVAPFDLVRLIERTTNAVRPQAHAKGLELRAEMAPQLGTVAGDERRAEQVLLNLLGNAVKFTEHGEVSVRVDTCMPGVPGGTAAACVRICVSDTGIGIRREDLATLFQPFRQIDSGLTRKYEGTGLGLAICRRLVELMGGSIEVDSAIGRGSTFTVTLPLAAPGAT